MFKKKKDQHTCEDSDDSEPSPYQQCMHSLAVARIPKKNGTACMRCKYLIVASGGGFVLGRHLNGAQ